MGVIAQQSIKGALANYAGIAIGFVTTFFVLTRCLTAEEVGLTRVMVDAAVLFSSLAMLGTNSTVVRFFPTFRDGAHHHGIFGFALLLPLVGFGLLGLGLLLFREQAVALYNERSPLLADYFYLLPMLTFFAMYLTVFETNASVLMHITVPKMIREVGIRLFTLAAYVLYGLRLIGFEVFMWLFCGCYALATLLALGYLLRITGYDLRIFRIDRQRLDRRMLREMLRYSLMMTAVVLAGNVPLMSSLFLGAQTGLAATGVFAVALYIANVVDVPYRSLGAISRPVIAQAVRDDDWQMVNTLGRQVSLHQMMASLVIFYLIWINVDALFAIIPNGANYAGGAGVVLILGLARVFNSTLSIGTDILNYSHLYSRALPFVLLLTVGAIVFNRWLIGLWGINGAAAATLLAYALYYAALLAYLWLRLRVHLFSVGQLKLTAVVGAGLVANLAWQVWIAPCFPPTAGLWVVLGGAALKSVVLGGAVAAAVMAWRVSPTVNTMLADKMKRK